jgi:hypothetical protein
MTISCAIFCSALSELKTLSTQSFSERLLLYWPKEKTTEKTKKNVTKNFFMGAKSGTQFSNNS